MAREKQPVLESGYSEFLHGVVSYTNADIHDAEMPDNRAIWQKVRDRIRADNPGEFALITRGELVGTYPSEEDAEMAASGLCPQPGCYVIVPPSDDSLLDEPPTGRQMTVERCHRTWNIEYH